MKCNLDNGISKYPRDAQHTYNHWHLRPHTNVCVSCVQVNEIFQVANSHITDVCICICMSTYISACASYICVSVCYCSCHDC